MSAVGEDEEPVDNSSAYALLDALRSRQDQGISPPFTEMEFHHLSQVAETWQGPLAAITHWRIALNFIATAHEADYERAQTPLNIISDRLLRRREFTRDIAWQATIPLLTRLVHVAILVGLPETARDALRAYRHRVNQLAALSPDSVEYIMSRPSARLEPAAFLAFERLDRELAVLCAEAGRLKLLSRIADNAHEVTKLDTTEYAFGIARAPGIAPQTPASSILGDADGQPELIDFQWTYLPFNLSQDEYNQQLLDLAVSGNDRWWLGQMLLPWRPASLYSGGDRPVAATMPSPFTRSSLVEPTLNSIGRSIGPDRIVIYPFFTRKWVGAVFLTSDVLHSFKADFDSVDAHITSLGEHGILLDPAEAAGHLVGISLSRYMKGKIPHVMSWSADQEVEVRGFASGLSASVHSLAIEGPEPEGEDPTDESKESGDFRIIPAVMTPSARLLLPTTPIEPPQCVAYIGDTEPGKRALAGPWVEAACWEAVAQSFGAESSVALGTDATRSHLRSVLQNAHLLALGIHATNSAFSGPALELADGSVAFDDILAHVDRVPAQIVLASCTAAASASHAPSEDALGLATALLATGARRVLAPVTPVHDLTSAFLMHVLCQQLAQEPDLRKAWGVVGLQVRAWAADPSATIRRVLGREPLVRTGFPYPPQTIARGLAKQASALHETYRQFVLFGA